MSLAVAACATTGNRPGASSAEHAEDDDHEGDHHHGGRALPSADSAEVARVRVLPDDSLGCPTEVLGTVDVHEPMPTEAAALSQLKREAAAMGAEAVTGVEFHHGEGGHEVTHLSGMAVRCRDLIRGRRYEILGSVDVPAQMGHDEEAFEEMRNRGARMGADLMIEIEYEHGEGAGSPSHVKAKAIRFTSKAAGTSQ